MIGEEFTVGTDYSDAATVGPYGYPVQILISCDQAVFMQFFKRQNIASRVTEELQDVPFPQGDYRFGNCYGIKLKKNGATAAKVFAISVMKEDPIVQGFSPSN